MVELIDGDLSFDWCIKAVKAKTVGMDIETSGLNKSLDKIATVQMYVPNEGTVMLRHFNNPIRLKTLLEDKNIKKIFHHAPFDLAFLVRDFGVWPDNIADTKIAAKILDPKRKLFIHPVTGKGSHTLLSLVYYYFNEVLDKQLAISNWFAKDLDPAQLDYAEKDVCYLPTILEKIESVLSPELLHLAHDAYRHIPTHVLLEAKNYEDVYGY